MKKLYTLTLAVLATIGAQATTITAAPHAKTAHKLTTPRTATAVKTPAKAADTDYSTYTWTEKGAGKYAASVIPDYYSSASTAPADVTVYEAEEQPGLYKITGVWSGILGDNGQLIVDASDPDFVLVPIQNTGIMDNVDGPTYICNTTAMFIDMGFSKEEILEVAPEMALKNVDGMITFVAGELLVGWPEAPEDSQYGTDPEDWYQGDSEGYLLLPGGTFVNPWTELGVATYLDNTLYSFATGVENTTAAPVKVYQKTGEPTLFKIEHPFTATYALIGSSNTSPDMLLYADDPDNVLIPMTSSGLSTQTDGTLYYFSESWYNEEYGDGADATEEELRVTLKEDDEYLTFTIPVNSITIYGYVSSKFYYGSDYVSTLKVSKKTTEGINSAMAADDNAPVEYYNLQGIKVDTPAAGLYICRRGSNVTKIAVK